MVISSAGTLVLVKFPFSDLSDAKLRPAISLANAGREDWILCQVTSKGYSDTGAILIGDADFAVGSLRRESYARPSKLCTANSSIVVGLAGRLHQAKLNEIPRSAVALFERSIK